MMEFFIEIKRKATHDPFKFVTVPADSDKTRDFHLNSLRTAEVQGQLVTYANAQWSRQFRTRIFSVFICGQMACFILWDRSAAIVTEAVNYIHNPHDFLKVLWRYNFLSAEHRGYDTTVVDPDPHEVLAAKDALQLEATNGINFIKLSIPHASQPDAYYVAEVPAFTSRSPFGKGTRGFPAYDLQNKKVVWVKDYWRTDAPDMEKEGDIYADLHRYNIPHIPVFERGGDIKCSALCSTSNYLKNSEPWARETPQRERLVLYRMAIGEVGRSLMCFQSSWEFVNAVTDAVEGKNIGVFTLR